MAPRVTAAEVFVYALCDPFTGEVRYVGVAVNVAKRLTQHRTDAKSVCERRPRHATERDVWLNGLTERGLLPSVRILEVTTPEEQSDREQHWQMVVSLDGARLLNNDSTHHAKSRLCPVCRRVRVLLNQAAIGDRKKPGRPPKEDAA